MKLISGFVSDTGNKKINQDAVYSLCAATNLGSASLAVVCDGMGGHEHGEYASAEVTWAFRNWFNFNLPKITTESELIEKIPIEWEELINRVNQSIKTYGDDNLDIKVGTTLVVVLVVNDMYFIASVGDSRVYLLQDNKISLITTDQSLVAHEVAIGLISKEDAKVDSRRNVLLQCIGMMEIVKPEIKIGRLTSNNNMFLLCTDGFWHETSQEEIYSSSMRKSFDISLIIKNNIKLINKIKERGEDDNITVAILGIKNNEDQQNIDDTLTKINHNLPLDKQVGSSKSQVVNCYQTNTEYSDSFVILHEISNQERLM